MKYLDVRGLHHFVTRMHERFGTNAYNMEKIVDPLHQFDLADYQNGDLFIDGVCIYMKIGYELRNLTNKDGFTYSNDLLKALKDLKKIIEINKTEHNSSQWLALLEV